MNTYRFVENQKPTNGISHRIFVCGLMFNIVVVVVVVFPFCEIEKTHNAWEWFFQFCNLFCVMEVGSEAHNTFLL